MKVKLTQIFFLKFKFKKHLLRFISITSYMEIHRSLYKIQHNTIFIISNIYRNLITRKNWAKN